jgi:hypothetical protein
MNVSGSFKTAVMAIDKRYLLQNHPGLIDRGVMLGIPEDVTLELIAVLADVLNMHVTLTEDLCLVENEMYNIFEFMTDPYLTGMNDPMGGPGLDRYNEVVYEATRTLRGMIPLEMTNIHYLSHFVDSHVENLFYIGGVVHLGAIPADYMYNEDYVLFK